MNSNITFLRHIHYFRALAIVNISFAHLWVLPESLSATSASAWIDSARELLFHGSTIYFLFISGFLFEYLSPRFRLLKYYAAKFQRVLLPYFFVTVSLIGLKAAFGSDPAYRLDTLLPQVWHSLLTGQIQVQFWYIPFILIVFAISPLLLKIPRRLFSVLALGGALLPLMGTRTGTELTFFQFVYFFPVYLVGMYTCRRYGELKPHLQQLTRPLIATVGMILLLMILAPEEYPAIGPFNANESLHYVQKMAFTFLALSVLVRLEGRRIPVLNVLAEYSFAIYFLHVFIGEHPQVKNLFFPPIISSTEPLLFVVSIAYVFVAIFLTWLFCLAIKLVFGKYSKYLIGA